MDFKHEVAASAVQALPAAAVVGVHIAGLSINEWAAVAGIAFIILQAAFLIWKWRREIKERK